MTIPQWIIFIPLGIAAFLALLVLLISGLSTNRSRVVRVRPMIIGLAVGLAFGATLGAMLGYETGATSLMLVVGASAGATIGVGIGGTYQMWLQ